MLLSTQTDALCTTLGDKEGLKLLKEAGFDAFDYSFFPGVAQLESPLCKDDYLDYYKEIRKYAQKIGIVCNQAHAPFASAFGEPEKDELRFKFIVRSMECAAVLGAEIVIVHPVKYLPYNEKGNPEKLKELNFVFYDKLIPYCEKFNIKVAIENMWEGDKKTNTITHSTCSRAEEFCQYIDMMNSRYIVGCLDVGHTSLVRSDTCEMIRALGADRLKALHIHDTDCVQDLHTLPFDAKLDHEKFAKTLGEINYQGDFTFEANNFLKKFPIECYPAALKLMHDVGRYLMKIVEENRTV